MAINGEREEICEVIVGTGIDLVCIERVERAVKRHGQLFLDKLFTSVEQGDCLGRHDPGQRLAARFAVKEAVAKAFGVGIGPLGWLDIETVTGERGCPSVVLHGPAQVMAQERRITHVWISLSHEGGFAIAQAILEG